jgi:hypothetical protein
LGFICFYLVNSHGLIDVLTQYLFAAAAKKALAMLFTAITNSFLIFYNIPVAFFRC